MTPSRAPPHVLLLMLVLLAGTSLSGCIGAEEDERPLLRILSYNVFALSEAVIADFEETHGARVEVLKVDDTGAVLDRALQAQAIGVPIADLVIGLDTTHLPEALDAGLFQPWSARTPGDVRSRLSEEAVRPHPVTMAVPYDWGHVCLNVDEAWLKAERVPVPTSLWNLTVAPWTSHVVVQNPRTSSPGRAFLTATVDHFRNDGDNVSGDNVSDHRDWWSAMRQNDLIIVDSWSQAYEIHYSGGYGRFVDGHIGDAHAVVSYCHSPGAEAYWSENGSTRSLALDIERASLLQVEYAGITANALQPDLAGAFIAHLLSDEVQATLPDTQVMWPAVRGLGLPAGPYTEHSLTPTQGAEVSGEEIAANMARWLDEWDQAITLRRG